MTDIRLKLEAELESVTTLITSKSKEVISAKKKYDFSFTLTILAPTAFFLLQICFTWDSLVWNPADQSLWAGIKDTFSFSIGTFGVLAAITGMLGFNHRAKQLDLQQLRASKQVIMAELQFDLANKQFITSQARENLKLFYEHESIFEKQLEHVSSKLEKLHGEPMNIILDSKHIYNSLFPDNSPDSGVIDHDPKWPESLGGWTKKKYGSFRGYVQQIKDYAKEYPLISNNTDDFEYEANALIDIYNTIAAIGFNKYLEDDAVKSLATQFKYIQDIVFTLDYFVALKVITIEEKTQALDAMYNLFGGLFWPEQLNIGDTI
ncbi:hypothetical protein AT00_21040 [Pseudoalteromonas lipolytica SCSIO 04301]|uniref:hypothetical protein n=1 Tax=Pseudoalteromonas lipolytica TaxID=570156 RepID=UPI000448DB84|nr:hypothetical protein [Pseudoalteromonas lipolytica]EWH04291.1 hypothetical protein AT00_21040 [Pseudoalteromonas lipolytica SCSIO 04301]